VDCDQLSVWKGQQQMNYEIPIRYTEPSRPDPGPVVLNWGWIWCLLILLWCVLVILYAWIHRNSDQLLCERIHVRCHYSLVVHYHHSRGYRTRKSTKRITHHLNLPLPPLCWNSSLLASQPFTDDAGCVKNKRLTGEIWLPFRDSNPFVWPSQCLHASG
jgi:hypothetical protein